MNLTDLAAGLKQLTDAHREAFIRDTKHDDENSRPPMWLKAAYPDFAWAERRDTMYGPRWILHWTELGRALRNHLQQGSDA